MAGINTTAPIASKPTKSGKIMTDIECTKCGHIRETTEEYPTLVTCENCGSYDVGYLSDTLSRR